MKKSGKTNFMILMAVLFTGCITIKHTYPTSSKIVKALSDSIPSIQTKTIFRNDDIKKISTIKFEEKTFQPPMSYTDFMTDDEATSKKYTEGTTTISKGEKLFDTSKSSNTEIEANDKNWTKTYQIQTKKTPFIYSYTKDVTKRPGDINVDNDCVTQYYNFNCQSSSFMNADFESQNQYLYPSAIYSVIDFEDGNFKDITDHRNPVTLSTDNPNLKGNSYITITNPNLVTIREGIQKLYGNFESDKSGNMDFRYQIFESSNNIEQQLKLATGGGGNYGLFGGNMETTLNNETKQTHHYVTVDIIKDMFTINSMCKNYFDTSSMYSSDKLVISSVTYGLRIMGNIDITGYENKIGAQIETSGNAGIKDVFSAHGHLDLTFLRKALGDQTKVNCYIVGGPNNSTCAFTIQDFQTAITNIVAGVTANNARPIQYTLSDLNGDVISIKSSVTNIKQRMCQPEREEPTVLTAEVTFITHKGNDADDKNSETQVTVDLKNSKNQSIAKLDKCCGGTRFPDDDVTSGPYDRNVEQNSTTLKKNINHGKVVIHLDGGTDKWHMSFQIKLTYSDDSTKVIGYTSPKDVSVGKDLVIPY